MTEPESEITVLIVDDHKVFAESLARLLSDEEGVTVAGVVSDGSEAIELAARLQPRVILMDYRMPDRDGITTMTSGFLRLMSAVMAMPSLSGIR